MGSLRKEVCKIFNQGKENNYGGSLAPFKFAIPLDEGTPRHEMDKTPYCLRYEISLITCKEDE
jgi:hypothetical protein